MGGWTLGELTLGLVAASGISRSSCRRMRACARSRRRRVKLAHEPADALWSVIVIAARCDVDLEAAFVETMDELDGWLARATASEDPAW